MAVAVIVDAVRTAGGRRGGQLSGWHPADLAGEVLARLAERNDLDPALVDDVVMGCVMQVGDQGLNVGRSAVLAAGFPEAVPATTIDRQCGSSQQAAHFAAQAVMAGGDDVTIAAGVEVMSTTPMGSTRTEGSFPFGPRVTARFEPDGGLVSQGVAAELVARQWNLSRAELDEYSARSHELAEAATAEGRFEREILAVPVHRLDADAADPTEKATRDEGIRPGSDVATLGGLKPVFAEDGMVTAGNSSQIADGASAALITTDEHARRTGMRTRARFVSFAAVGVNPRTMLTGPIPATARALERAGLTLDDIDLFEVNEAFAPVVLAWQRETGVPLDKVNVNGGSIALGHPLGASGTKLLATLLNELERREARYGLLTMCEGGGMANATIIERIP